MIPCFISPIAIFVNNGKALAESVAEGVQEVLRKHRLGYVTVPTNPDDKAMLKRDLENETFSWIISVGGDGTLLQAAHRAGQPY